MSVSGLATLRAKFELRPRYFSALCRNRLQTNFEHRFQGSISEQSEGLTRIWRKTDWILILFSALRILGSALKSMCAERACRRG